MRCCCPTAPAAPAAPADAQRCRGIRAADVEAGIHVPLLHHLVTSQFYRIPVKRLVLPAPAYALQGGVKNGRTCLMGCGPR